MKMRTRKDKEFTGRISFSGRRLRTKRRLSRRQKRSALRDSKIRVAWISKMKKILKRYHLSIP